MSKMCDTVLCEWSLKQHAYITYCYYVMVVTGYISISAMVQWVILITV